MRHSHRIRAGLTMLLVASLAVAAAPAVAEPTFSETVVAGGTSPVMAPMQASPEMDGRYIAYEFTPGFDIGGAVDTDIKVYDIKEGVTYDVSDRTGDNDNDVNDTSPDVSMDTVVYQSMLNAHANVYLYNTTWYNWRPVTNKTAAQTLPRISGRYILWHDADTDALWFYSVDWPQYMNQWMPGTVGVYYGSWDIDGDTVIFARETTAGNFTFYKWTVWSDAAPEAFATHTSAGQIADVRLHHDTMTYTYGAALDKVNVKSLRGVSFRPPFMAARDGDVFHGMYAYENLSAGGIGLVRDGLWATTLGAGGAAETNPSVFGNRVVFERDVNNRDIIMARASEPLADRTAGDDRYKTAAAVSSEYFSTGADDVVLCTGEDFPDALSAAPWARFLKAPVLLTRRTAVPSAVMDEIERLGAKNVWIIGGESAVSSSVQTQLETAGLHVDRQLQGTDRYATSAKVAMFLYDALMADGRPFSNRAFVARGDAFPDALAVAPVAATTYSPILLVRTQAPLPPEIDDVFEFLPIWDTWIAGGTDVVSEGVEEAIEAWNKHHTGVDRPATRMAGDDRYETSARVMQNAVSMNWVDLDTLGIATGLNFPDALGGGAALGTYGSPLVLTRPDALPPKVADAVTYRAHEIGRVDIFGGSDVVSNGVRTTIVGLLP